VVATLPAASPAAAEIDEAALVAARRLDAATAMNPDGSHNARLRALRHLRDRKLKPLFQSLSRRDATSLRIHGLLGLAELRNPPRLSLSAIAQVNAPAARAELISAGLDNDLIRPAAIERMLEWDDLPAGVEMLLAMQRVGAANAELRDAGKAALWAALRAPTPARRALAALLLAQVGEIEDWPSAAGLRQLNQAELGRVAPAVLRAALEHGLSRAGRWAFRLAREPGIDAPLRRLALHAAIRFSVPGATEQWQARFQVASGPAKRMRLALRGLRSAASLNPEAFAPLAASERAVFNAMAAAGRAIAADASTATDRVIALMERDYPALNRWALSYAREQAPSRAGARILLAVILAGRDAEQPTRSDQLQIIADAVQALHERAPEMSSHLLRPLLRNRSGHGGRRYIQGILLGLVRSGDAEAAETLEDLPAFQDPPARQLASLAKARAGLPLTDSDRQALETIVRGRGAMRPTLRTQAAWLYLKRTGQLEPALRQTLSPASQPPNKPAPAEVPHSSPKGAVCGTPEGT